MEYDAKKNAWRKAYEQYCAEKIPGEETNLQNVFTPFFLCSDIVGKLKESVDSFDGLVICVFNLEFAEILIGDYGVKPEQIWFITDSVSKSRFARGSRYNGIHVEVVDYVSYVKNREDREMKFDVVIMNPPYQGYGSKNSIWHKFVYKAFDLVGNGGFIVSINPVGWRGTGMFRDVGRLIRSKSLKYIKMFGNKAGQKHFKESTSLDCLIIQNSHENQDTGVTTVVDRHGLTFNLRLQDLPFIPNFCVSEVMSLVAKNGEPKVNLLYSRSAYGADKPHVSKEMHGEFQHPCAYSIKTDDSLVMRYSSTREKGHFGVPKIIVGDGCNFGVFKDIEGAFGMTQWCFGIVDDPCNFDHIETALKSTRFQRINEASTTKNTAGIGVVDRNILKYFRKDFWKEFVNEDGTEKTNS